MTDTLSFCDVRLVGRIVSVSGQEAELSYLRADGTAVSVRVSVQGGASGSPGDMARVLGELTADGRVLVTSARIGFVTEPGGRDVPAPPAVTVPVTVHAAAPAAPAATVVPAPQAPQATIRPPFSFGRPAPSGGGTRAATAHPVATPATTVGRAAPAGLSPLPAAPSPRAAFGRHGIAPPGPARMPSAAPAVGTAPSGPPAAPIVSKRRTSMVMVSRTDDDDPTGAPGGEADEPANDYRVQGPAQVRQADVPARTATATATPSRRPPTNPDDIDREIPF